MLISQSCVIEIAPSRGKVGKTCIFRTGDGEKEPLIARVQLAGECEDVLSMTSSNSSFSESIIISKKKKIFF